MQIFITGTDTNIGKTLACSWLCLHSGYSYFKPIQTGAIFNTDSKTVAKIANVKTYDEIYKYPSPVSPHLAAKLQNEEIDIYKIKLPTTQHLIVEGAGGVMVPINNDCFMIDLIKHLSIPVIVVASTKLGTINHTLLTLMALKARNIKTLGVILSGQTSQANSHAIQTYANIEILAHIPLLKRINQKNLATISLTQRLKQILQINGLNS
jgi:dethiobiotin synthetase